MRAVMQRVRSAVLSVGGEVVSEIGQGLVVYLGVGKGDSAADAELVSRKIANLRVFEDEQGKMNFSVLSQNFDILLVSQFTLYGDARKGNRPSFSEAEAPNQANALYEAVAATLKSQGLTVKTGVFGADMKIMQDCDGPVTILFDSKA